MRSRRRWRATPACLLRTPKPFRTLSKSSVQQDQTRIPAIHVVYLSGPVHFHHWPNCPKDGQELRSFPHLSLLTQSQDLAPVQCDF